MKSLFSAYMRILPGCLYYMRKTPYVVNMPSCKTQKINSASWIWSYYIMLLQVVTNNCLRLLMKEAAMNNFFSLRRFGLLFIKHSAEHYRTYLMAIAVLTGVALL